MAIIKRKTDLAFRLIQVCPTPELYDLLNDNNQVGLACKERYIWLAFELGYGIVQVQVIQSCAAMLYIVKKQ